MRKRSQERRSQGCQLRIVHRTSGLRSNEKTFYRILTDGHQVRINLLLRGRENAKRDMAFALVNKFIVSLGEVNISKEPKLEGKIVRAVVAKKNNNMAKNKPKTRKSAVKRFRVSPKGKSP